MARIPSVRTDIGQSIRRHCEEPFPCVRDGNVVQGGKQPVEILAQRQLSLSKCERALTFGQLWAVASTQNETVIVGPTGVMIRSFGIPEHHVAYAESYAFARRQSLGRQDISVLHGEPT